MCGICGILNLANDQPVAKLDIDRMSQVMVHRGPDDSGMYLEDGFGMASRRLAIIDLSAEGHMPMKSLDGRYWIINNGEVYNYIELKKGLEAKGITFHSKSDTEVLLYLYIEHGPAMLDICQGMFAFVIWDQQEKSLFAARDRMGVKPFYYAIHEGRFYFSSEEKSLFMAGVPRAFDDTCWAELLLFRYVAGEKTPYRSVSRLLPGHYLEICNGNIRIIRWWALNKIISPDYIPPEHQKSGDAFRQLFDESISLRRISDVPIGALLSGGLDSGSMAATMSIQAGEGVHSFTMRFTEPLYDEGELAKQVAHRWKMDHHDLYLPPEKIPAMLEDSTWYLDSPVVHGNDLHLLAIARYAKSIVSVLLSGEGSDEILGGYVRYLPYLYPELSRGLASWLNKSKNIPFSNNRLGKMTEIFNMPNWRDRILFSSAEVFPKSINLPSGWEKFLAYRYMVVDEASSVYKEHVRQVMYYDQHTYLQSILDRNDRSTMGASIECREPFLDLGLLEWASNLPTDKLFSRLHGKQPLRRGMSNRLPKDILRHKKWGFGVPWGSYFRTIPSLRAEVQSLPESEIMFSCPIPRGEIKEHVKQFFAGDENALPLLRQLFFMSTWYRVCVKHDRIS